MELLWLLLAAMFLPLYPLSIVPNLLLPRVRAPWLKAVLLSVWALLGVLLLTIADVTVPVSFGWWGIGTALLYALRLLTVRDLEIWIGFAYSSMLALLWVVASAPAVAADGMRLALYALSFAVPLGLLVLLSATLIRSFGAAYLGLYRGLGVTMPHFSAIFILVILAVIATPLFPSFAMLLSVISVAPPLSLLLILLTWLFWGWAGINLMRGVVFGVPADDMRVVDLESRTLLAYVAALAVLIVAGFYLLGRAL